MGEIENHGSSGEEEDDIPGGLRASQNMLLIGPLKSKRLYSKEILSLKSRVFKNMFFGPNAVQGPVEIPDIDVDVFGQICQFIETHEIGFMNLRNIARLCEAAYKYEIEGLLCKCADYLHPGTVEDSFTALDCGVKYDIQPLAESAMEIIRKNTTSVFRSAQFMTLSQAAVLMIVKDKKLNIEESAVLSVCVLWARYQCQKADKKCSQKNLREELGEIFSHIRFLVLLDSKYITRPGLDVLSFDELEYLKNISEREEWEFQNICRSREPRSGTQPEVVKNSAAPLYTVIFADHIADSVTCLKNVVCTSTTFVFKRTLNLISVAIPSRSRSEKDKGRIYYDEDLTISLIEVGTDSEELIGKGQLTGKQEIEKIIQVPLFAVNDDSMAPVVHDGVEYKIEAQFNMKLEFGHYPKPLCNFSTFSNLLNVEDTISFFIGFKYC